MFHSQELLEAVEQERNIRANRSHNTAVFHHPMLGDFEVGACFFMHVWGTFPTAFTFLL
jgi:hypothetical protein